MTITTKRVIQLDSVGNIADGDMLVGERVSGTTVRIAVTGVDKLAGIEAGATGDQTAAEIKTAYESNLDTNAFTDAQEAKLAAISGTNTGDQTITLTGDVTGSGTGSFAATIANSAVTLAKQANMATASLVYRKTAGAGAPEVNTLATLKTDLNLTGTNSGDQTSIVGITGTKAQFDTAVTDGNILYVGDVTQYTDELAQDAIGTMVDASLTYVDGTPLLQRAALTGDVTAPAGSNATTIANDAVTYAKLQNISATDKLLGRSSSGAGDAEEIACTAAGRALIDDADATAQRATLGLGTLATQSGTFSGSSSGTNTGDQTITLTGDVTGSGTGSFAATIANSAVTLAKQADMATASVVYRKTAGAGAPEVNTLATLKTDLLLTGTNSGDQTSIVGITGTKAQFDTAVTDGNILYVGDITQYTDELAQDAIGAMIDASLTYVDGTPLLQRAALTGDVTASAGSNATLIATPASATIATDDKVLIKDTSASNVMKYVLTQAIRDLVPGAGTITSAQLLAALTDASGTGAAFFAGGNAGAFTATSINFGDDTLSKYDFGGFTPVFAGSGTAGTPTGTFIGLYIKIGKMVLMTVQAVFSALTGMVGNLIMTGMPFTMVNNAAARAGPAVGLRANWTNDWPIIGFANSNSTTFNLYRGDIDFTTVVIGDMSATTQLYFQLIYEATS